MKQAAWSLGCALVSGLVVWFSLTMTATLIDLTGWFVIPGTAFLVFVLTLRFGRSETRKARARRMRARALARRWEAERAAAEAAAAQPTSASTAVRLATVASTAARGRDIDIRDVKFGL